MIKCIYCFFLVPHLNHSHMYHSFQITMNWLYSSVLFFFVFWFFGRNETKNVKFCEYTATALKKSNTCNGSTYKHKLFQRKKKTFISFVDIFFAITILCATLDLLDVNHKKVIFKHKKNKNEKKNHRL